MTLIRFHCSHVLLALATCSLAGCALPASDTNRAILVSFTKHQWQQPACRHATEQTELPLTGTTRPLVSLCELPPDPFLDQPGWAGDEPVWNDEDHATESVL